MELQQIREYLLYTEKGGTVLNAIILLIIASAGAAVARFVFFRKKGGLSFSAEGELRRLLQEGECLEAGELLLSQGSLERALECFSEIRYFRRMADIYIQKGLFQKAALMFERDLDYCSAADVYLVDGKVNAIYELAERAPNKAELAAYLADRGQDALAADIFMHARSYREAATIYARLGAVSKAADALEKKLRFSPPKDPSEELGIFRDLAECYTHLNQNDRAKEFLNKAADIENQLKKTRETPPISRDLSPSKIFVLREQDSIEHEIERSRPSGLSRMTNLSRSSQERSKLATALKKTIESASGAKWAEQDAQRLLKEGKQEQAAEAYLANEKFREAASIYEERGDFELAAEIFAKAEDYEKAGCNYEKIQSWKLALQCYEMTGNIEKITDLARKLKEWMRLGMALLNEKRYEEAISAFEKINKEDVEYPQAVKMLAKAYYSVEKFSIAKALFQEYEQNHAPNKSERLESRFYKAISAGKDERFEEAIKDLEELMQNNYRKEEVSKQLFEMRSNLEIHRTQIPASIANQIKQTIRYVREAEIGRGGMAMVFRAKDSVLGRTVALKVLLENFKRNAQAVEIFLREAKATAILKHPNIVTVFDAGHEADDYYIAMEFIEGTTLKSILKKRKLAQADLIRYAKQLATGLHYAHERRIVHRDMTTNNIMIDETDTLKIMDFGLVKILEKVQAEQSLIGGTPSYMAPEQILGKPVDRRADIYSFGICLFEMIAGRVPFSGGDASYHHLHSPAPDVRTLQAEAPEFLCEITAKCLQKKREERYQSLAEILELMEKKSIAAA